MNRRDLHPRTPVEPALRATALPERLSRLAVERAPAAGTSVDVALRVDRPPDGPARPVRLGEVGTPTAPHATVERASLRRRERVPRKCERSERTGSRAGSPDGKVP